ncbi:MAG: lipoyl(octanoyl) transferase LipB [Methylohalobius sp.]|nr:lipoyl(octanoyl) transferase LipB [Methylohalobius sp.]
MTELVVRWLGACEYLKVLKAMQHFTAARRPETPDEVWLLEHFPVYTAGVRAAARTPAWIHDIPCLPTDRGGLVTYHGPGQLVAYTLIDLARLGLSVRDLVTALEQATVALLAQYGLCAQTRPNAPGVYVAEAKIAFLGLRVKKAKSYHGLSLNVDLDLTPFQAIDPCGFKNLTVTRLADLGVGAKVHEVAIPWLVCLITQLGFSTIAELRCDLPSSSIAQPPQKAVEIGHAAHC